MHHLGILDYINEPQRRENPDGHVRYKTGTTNFLLSTSLICVRLKSEDTFIVIQTILPDRHKVHQNVVVRGNRVAK